MAGLEWSAWTPTALAAAVVSLVWGNLAALVQTSVKRLLAYSAVGHAGYLVLGFASGGARTMPVLEVGYGVIVYALAAAGAFGVVAVLETAGGGDDLDAFRGLGRRSPVLAGLLAVFILSLAGIPPLAGFLGKFLVLLAVLRTDDQSLLWTCAVGLAAAASVVSFYYYLQLLKRVFVSSGPPEAARLPCPALPLVVLVALAGLLVALGLVPGLLTDWIATSLR